MVKYPKPVRINTAVEYDYTFRDQDNAPIPLTPYSLVNVEAKLEGVLNSEVSAQFVSKPAGAVKIPALKLTSPGTWQLQFICSDGATPPNLLPGEPLQVIAVKNEPDADLTEILRF